MKKLGVIVTSTVAALSTLAVGLPASAAAAPDPLTRQAVTSSAVAKAAQKAAPKEIEVVRTASGSYAITWDGAGRHRVYASTKARNPSRSGKLVGTSKWGSLSVKGLDDGARWYFEIASPEAAKAARVTKRVRKNGKTKVIRRTKDVRGVIAATRGLGLDSVSNARDLGGLKTVDGRSIRWGLLFRSEAVTAPTVRDQAILAKLGLQHSADFRAESEVAKNGANRYPGSLTQHSVVLLDAATDALSIAIQGALRSGDPQVVQDLLGDGKAEEIARDGLVDLVLSQAGRDGFAQILRVLAQDEGAPLIFNCTAGKDRTGAFAAIVQRLLGVSERNAMADYELSNVYRRSSNEATYTRLEGIGVDRRILQPLLEQDGDNLAGMFRAIDEAYGSFDRFLVKGLGLDVKTIRKIQANLLV
ncbi:tyrosine-protein phosphatase [Nocardioides sp. W7]|uniref:tyrosine-protein phosphatase n=1 Tax=Nocardioides sp. W7 TaxID=2931390 RepID=UPI001FD4F31F|nr:tyrosine-protein phosphatase [Nocardioides sp. W7]